jgi:hypothetical protein
VVNATETIQAIAIASGYSPSAVASATYTINTSENQTPVVGSLSPAYTAAGSAAFTLTVTGSGFASGSTVFWASTALATQFVSSTELTAQVTAAQIASDGTAAITVQTPSPGGGTSNAMQFEVDSSNGPAYAPKFSSATATANAGSAATYAVTLPSSATNVSATCLNLPSGVTCSYSASAGTVTISTSSTTPTGTYLITVVFTETVPGSITAATLLPILFLPLFFWRRKIYSGKIWLAVCLGLAVLACSAFAIGCGGGVLSSPAPTNTTQTITSSGSVTLNIQ